jgi:hypothetical protein
MSRPSKPAAAVAGVAIAAGAAAGAAYGLYMLYSQSSKPRSCIDIGSSREMDAVEVEASLQPDRIIGLLSSMLDSKDRHQCIADVGAGVELFTDRLARAFSSARVYATSCDGEKLARLRDRVASAGLADSFETVCVPRGTLRVGLPEAARVLLFLGAFHELGGGIPRQRVEYLRACVTEGDVQPGGHAVVIERKPGGRTTGVSAPPWPDVERSAVIQAFEQVRSC